MYCLNFEQINCPGRNWTSHKSLTDGKAVENKICGSVDTKLTYDQNRHEISSMAGVGCLKVD